MMKRFISETGSRSILFFLFVHLTFSPVWLQAKPIHLSTLTPPDSSALPEYVSSSGNGWDIASSDSEHYLEIVQSPEANRVVIEWKSFDIGSDAHVNFIQGSGTALNRIGGGSPSQIYGQLDATGTIYLINKNGILFGQGSRTNVNSLVASSLNISDEDFHSANAEETHYWRFKAEGYEPGNITNKGTITSTADSGGIVFLLGSNVTNAGEISVEQGRIGLAAAGEFELSQKVSDNEIKEKVVVSGYLGDAVNTSEGRILADAGQLGIYGKIVRQNGLIRSLSTVQNGASIELVASEGIRTGAESVIDASVAEMDQAVLATTLPTRKIDIKNAGETIDSRFLIDLNGTIKMPSGTINIDAGDGGRIYLGRNSLIDVSGVWIESSAEDKVMSAQLNSLELRDEFIQKNRDLLGETIYFLPHKGVNIGNVSEHLENQNRSASELAATGGIITMSAGDGDIIVDQHAMIDISGGGTHYAGGYVQTSKLLDGNNQVHEIADAPDYLEYTSFINTDGNMSEAYKTYLPAHVEGSDAGVLNIEARQVVYEGGLDASVKQGVFQVNARELFDSLGYQKSIGARRPLAGSLNIGNLPSGGLTYQDLDPVVESIVIKKATPGLDPEFDPESSVIASERNRETWISDDLLNNAGLANVRLDATRIVKTEAGTSIKLVPGGSLAATGRRVLHQGEISIHSGTVSLDAYNNKSSTAIDIDNPADSNPNYVPDHDIGPNRVELASGSRIDTSGERHNNYTEMVDGTAEYRTKGQWDGGSIVLSDTNIKGEGVIVREGSELDVSGGYLVGFDKKVADSGDAGNIEILGPAIVLDGSVKGYSMVGKNGGSINLHAVKTSIVTDNIAKLPDIHSSEDALPDSFKQQLIIDDNRFNDTGFANISYSSMTDLVVGENVQLSPSQTKIVLSQNTRATGLVNVPMDYYAGKSSISLKAGIHTGFLDEYEIPVGHLSQTTSHVIAGKNVNISVAGGGSISIEGPGADISGIYNAPGGEISITSTSNLSNLPLKINSDARFYARGYNQATDDSILDTQVFETESGGTISFSSANVLKMGQGAIVDVSGSDPLTTYRLSENNQLQASINASSPGTVNLKYLTGTDTQGESTIEADFIGNKSLGYLHGAQFNLHYTNSSPYEMDSAMIDRLENSGFDYLTVKNVAGIAFAETQTIDMARGVVFNTPSLIGKDGITVTVNTGWLQFQNTNMATPAPVLESGSASRLVFNAEFIDMTGLLNASRFSDVNLNARQDIRLTDYYYTENNPRPKGWFGEFSVEGNLTMSAARIYPTSESAFTINTTGDFTTHASDVSLPPAVYSALGKLTVNSKNIYHHGYIAAPAGQIHLNASERVYLDQDSVLTVAGQLDVNIGDVDDSNLKWYRADHNSDTPSRNMEVTYLPEKEINIKGNEVIGRDESTIAISGGGSVYGYTFMSGIDGTMDPLAQSGTYVILPLNNVLGNVPGQAVYLEESYLKDSGETLEAGVYTLLPAEYAFVEGAKVIEFQGALRPGTTGGISNEGYSTIVGYSADQMTGNISGQADVYTIRAAPDVMQQGRYEIVGLSSGDAGTLTVTASTNIMNSRLRAQAAGPGYRGGIVNLSGENVIFSSSSSRLGDEFLFDTQIASDKIGKLFIAPSQYAGSGLYELNVGNTDLTQNITFEDNTSLSGTRIGLYAQGNIVLGQNVIVNSTGEAGMLSLVSADGRVVMGDGSKLDSTHTIAIDANGLDRGVNTNIAAAKAMFFSSDHLYLADTAHMGSFTDGLVVGNDLMNSFTNLEQISLTGREKIGFAGNIAINAQNASLVMNSPLVADVSTSSGQTSFSVKEAGIFNSQKIQTAADDYAGNDGVLTVNAERITIGPGNNRLSGYRSVNLNSENNLTFRGKGSFNTGNADLSASSAQVTGTYRFYETGSDNYVYEALDYKVNAGTGDITLLQGAGIAEAGDNIGGRLIFEAGRIENSGTVDLSSGVIGFVSTGSDTGDGIYMTGTSKVGARGSRYENQGGDYDYYDAGHVYYIAENADIDLAAGSVSDVSAGTDNTHGNAGTISIYNPNGNCNIQGDLVANSISGKGGLFEMDIRSYADISGLATKLSNSGFSESMDMRIRQGDVVFSSTALTRNFRLSADSGNVTINGMIDASGDTGGNVDIYSGRDLLLTQSAQVYARGTGQGADGGRVTLGSGITTPGTMILDHSVIDVSALNGGTNGKIHLRAARTGTNDEVLLSMKNTQLSSDQVMVEAVEIYNDSNVRSSDMGIWESRANSFMANETAITDRFVAESSGSDHAITLVPGIEVQSSGAMRINSNLDFTNLRFGADNLPAVISFRSAGDLFVRYDILDHPTDSSLLQMDTAQQSTTFNFSSGAALSSSDIFAVNRGVGDLNFRDKKMVYTESGDINFASGNQTIIGKEYYGWSASQSTHMAYNGAYYTLGSYNGKIKGKTGGDLVVKGVIQTATGDIDLESKKDIQLLRTKTGRNYNIGSIRTTGQPISPQAFNDKYGFSSVQYAHGYVHDYNSGGSININSGGDVRVQDTSGLSDETYLNPEAWDSKVGYYKITSQGYEIEYDLWAASYNSPYTVRGNGSTASQTTQGIATMAGGDIHLTAEGVFFGQIGTFGKGNLAIKTLGNIDGRYLNHEGELELSSNSNIGSMPDNPSNYNAFQSIEAFDTQIMMKAAGSISLATVMNPTIARAGFNDDKQWNLQYTQNASLTMSAKTGDITLTGNRVVANAPGQGAKSKYRVLPPSLSISAGNDVIVSRSFYLPPAENGQLSIIAGRDIINELPTSTIFMSDVDPGEIYGEHSVDKGASSAWSYLSENNDFTHAIIPVHLNDADMAQIRAGRDIRNLALVIPKAAEVDAGRDIYNLFYVGQNLDPTDTTLIHAGRDLIYQTLEGIDRDYMIEVGGSGLTVVQAGNNIDLGSSLGIMSVGNRSNLNLSSGDNDLIIVAGIAGGHLDNSSLDTFFGGLRQASADWAAAWASGDTVLADQIITDARNDLVYPIFGEDSGSGMGNINLVNSKVLTRGGTGTIYTLARGEINVGLSDVKQPGEITSAKESGFYTVSGGAVKMYAKGDINVNQSRIMTFSGGDIDILSDHGDINAGRGSKAALASAKTVWEYNSDVNMYLKFFEPPAVGSGIRATALDVKDAGDIYPTAWEGVIDAGEAGIAGKNVVVAATTVLNAQNISASGFSSGFSSGADGGADLAGFSGGGALADTAVLDEDSNPMESARNRMNEQPPEGYSVEPRWVDVEVIEFEEDEEEEEEDG